MLDKAHVVEAIDTVLIRGVWREVDAADLSSFDNPLNTGFVFQQRRGRVNIPNPGGEFAQGDAVGGTQFAFIQRAPELIDIVVLAAVELAPSVFDVVGCLATACAG